MKSALIRTALVTAILASNAAFAAVPSANQVDSAIQSGNYALAESLLSQVVQAKPSNAKAWLMLAQTEAKLGNREKASAAFAKTQSLDSNVRKIDAAYDNASYFLKTADSASSLPTQKQVEDAFRSQNYPQAESMLGQVTAAKPENAKAWYLLSQAEEKLGKYGQSKRDLSRAESLDSSLKFASPGAVATMHQRLDRLESGRSVATSPHVQQPQTIPGYADRPAVGTAIQTATAPIPMEPAKPASHAWIYFLLLILAAGGGAYWYMNKRAKEKALDDSERTRKAFLSRANALQERSGSLFKTARFEGQESSAFGVSASGLVSRANSKLGLLKPANAQFDPYREKNELDTLEAEVEALETQGARKQWNAQPLAVHSAASSSPTATDTAFDNTQAFANQQPQGFPASPQASGFGGYPAGYNAGYPPQAPVMVQQPTTVIVGNNSGPGLLETLIVADAIRGSHRHDSDYDRGYDRPHHSEYNGGGYSQSAAPAVEAPSAVDLGGSSGGWDSGSSSSDNSSSSSSSDSSWDSGSSSSDSGSSSSSSSDDGSW